MVIAGMIWTIPAFCSDAVSGADSGTDSGTAIPGSSALAPTLAEATLAEIKVPAGFLHLLKQAMAGPRHELLTVEYAQDASTARAANGDLSSKLSTSFQLLGVSPLSSSSLSTGVDNTGLVAGPTLTYTLPIGKGQLQLNLGLAARVKSSDGSTAFVPQAGLSANLPLFAGKDTRRSAAQFDLAQARYDYQVKKRQLIADTIAAGFQYRQAEIDLTLADLALHLAQAEYEKATLHHSQGLLSYTELSRLRSAWYAAQDDQLAAQRALSAALHRLQNLTGKEPSSLLPATAGYEAMASNGGAQATSAAQVPAAQVPAAPPDILHPSRQELPQDEKGWIDLAIAIRGDVQLAREAVKLAADELNRVKATAHRNISLVAGVSWPKELSETKTDLRTDVHLGISGTVYLFDIRRSETVTLAELQLSEAELRMRQTIAAVEQAVANAWWEREAAARALALAMANLDREELLLAATKERLLEGLAVPLDVLAQELAVAQQKARVHRLEANLAQLTLALWQAAGLDIAELNI